ncbi:hypothetical protein BH23THE1_BH23THE1_31100 [soil metagenome]
MCGMVCTCTFQAYRLGERLQDYLALSKRNHVSVWIWIQKYNPQRISSRRNKISEFIIDETLIKVGFGYIWLWVATEPENR